MTDGGETLLCGARASSVAVASVVPVRTATPEYVVENVAWPDAGAVQRYQIDRRTPVSYGSADAPYVVPPTVPETP